MNLFRPMTLLKKTAWNGMKTVNLSPSPNANGDINSDESKKNEGGIRYVPLKEIRAWLRDPKIKAVDISDWSFSQCKESKNNHTLETICISTGTYGPSGGVFEDEDGTYYVCTHRGTGLTYLAP